MIIDSSIFQRYSLFGGLEREHIDNILPLMERMAYEVGRDILTEGTLNNKVCFILEGRVAVVKNGVILAELKEGDFFGEMEVLDIMPTEATIKALESTTVMTLSNAALREIYKSDLKIFSLIIMNLARDVSRRLRRMNNIAAKESPPMDWN